MGIAKTLTYVEIDIDYCSLSFGVGACTASGSNKCFNTRNILSDCQDPANYTSTTKTIRFGKDNGFLPEDIPCIPNIVSATTSEAIVRPGENIGERATLTVKFKNHKHGDAGLDKYIADRSYNPFESGSFWGKFKARNPYTQYRACRLIRGEVGQSIDDMEVEHFVIDSINGPDSNGQVILKGVDFMRLLDGKTSQAPAASKGYLSTNISATTTSVTLSPAGIGSTYPSSGIVAIGEELCDYTISGDVLTLTREQYGTVAEEHDADDVVQIVIQYTSQTCAYIIDDLITHYTPLGAGYTDLTAWNDKVLNYSDVLYSALIVKPESVKDLIDELVEQAGLVVFGDNKKNEISFDLIRNTSTTASIIDDNKIIKGTFKQKEQPSKRYSQVWIFYHMRDVFKNHNDAGNYYSGIVDVVPDNQYETESIKRIYSRWIPSGGRSIAADVAKRIKARYVNAPRAFAFSLFYKHPIKLGQTIPVSHMSLEDCSGNQVTTDCTIVGLRPEPEGCAVTAEEMNFDTSILSGDKVITIDSDSLNINLRTVYDSLFASVDEANDITFIVLENVVVGSNSTSNYAMETGSWPAGATLYLINNGHIVGRGGDASDLPTATGGHGGDALSVSRSISIDNSNGIIGGGGGAGGGVAYSPFPGNTLNGRGGGGAGYNPGSGGEVDTAPRVDAGLENGGDGKQFTGSAYAGDGGDLGQSGAAGVGGESRGSGGAAGDAVVGDSNVTWTALGDIRGGRTG